MKRTALAVLLLVVIHADARSDTTPQKPDYVPDEIIVKFRAPAVESVQRQMRDGAAPSDLQLSDSLSRPPQSRRIRRIRPVFPGFDRFEQKIERLQSTERSELTARQQHILARRSRTPGRTRPPALDRIFRIEVATEPGESLQDVLSEYRNDPNVEYAELNHILRVRREPDDSRYAAQWALPKIAAPEAWDIYTGSAEVVVAVIDTGVDYNHRDLVRNMWINQTERDGQSGVDDDNNGYIDDIYGYNFVYNNADPMDDHGHGTHCAGIVAATTDNGMDIAGISWNARIMALKFMGSEGEGSTADVVGAFYYAVANGADVLSNSWGGDDSSELLEDTINFVHDQGVIMVAAAGNGGSDTPGYPASYDHMISVAASDRTNRLWSRSNYGSSVDLAAPGVDVLSLRAAGTHRGNPRDDYTTTLSGTSMACPHVAGACAMLLSLNPYLTEHQIYKSLTNCTDPLTGDACCAHGRLNLQQAMRAAVPSKGYLTFDRDYYRSAGRITIQLADSDLKGTGSRQLLLSTSAGDNEIVTLTEKDGAFGVFTATIAADSGAPSIDNGVIETAHNDVVAATYFDADNGSGIPAAVIADAITDNQPPTVLVMDVATKGPVAEVEIITSEQTRATLRYAADCDGPYQTIEDVRIGADHTFRVNSLQINTEYHFRIDLADLAGNTAVADSNGLCYTFTTDADFPGFLVPSVYATIQDALDAASDGDTVWVANGTYTGDGNHDIDFRGKAVALRSDNGPEQCIINCDSKGRAFTFHYGEDANSLVDGFTIRRGRGGTYGGALRCTASSPTITNCRFEYNAATDYGGAIHNSYGASPTIADCTFHRNWTDADFCKAGNGAAISNLVDSSPLIENCVFTENNGQYGGGAIYNGKNSNPTIRNCIFRRNESGHVEYDKGFGGAMFNEVNSNPLIVGCTFEKNFSKFDAGAIYVTSNSHPILQNCVFAQNHADGLGGAIKNFGGALTITNCTIVMNSAAAGSAIYNGPSVIRDVRDSIVWDNVDANQNPDPQQIFTIRPGEKMNANFCCIQGSTGAYQGMGNITTNPLFVDPENGDYHLRSEGWRWDTKRGRWHYDFDTSPCLDAGNPGRSLGDEPTSLPDDPDSDWAVNNRINIGAYGGTSRASLPPHDWALRPDLDNNGAVDFADYAIHLQQWHLPADHAVFADLDRNGTIGPSDLAVLAADWANHVKPPHVSITTPAFGAYYSIWPIEIPVVVDASDINGSVEKIEFFYNTRLFAVDESGEDGWTVTFTHDKGGVFDITARALDNSGASTTSQPIRITVVPPRH